MVIRIAFILLSICICSTVSSSDLPIKLLEGKKSKTIPISYIAGYIVVNLSVNDADPVDMIFDTGSQYTLFFDKQYADDLGVAFTDTINVVGSDLRIIKEAYISRETDIELKGSIPVSHDVLFLSEDINLLDEVIGRPISGILGTAFFNNLGVEIDYRRGQMKIVDATYIDQFTRKYDAQTEIEMIKNKPHIKYQLRDGSNRTALLDTGSPLPYTTYLQSLGDLPDNWIPGILGKGIGGSITGYLGLEDQLTILEQQFSKVMTRYQFINDLDSISRNVVEYRDAVIGNAILSQFDVMIDFMNHQIYTQPNRSYKATFRYNKSGIQVLKSGDDLNEYTVFAVNKTSPAYYAGVEKGDIILSCNYLRKRFLSLHRLARVFASKKDKTIKMKLKRSDEIIEKEFVLEAYLG